MLTLRMIQDLDADSYNRLRLLAQRIHAQRSASATISPTELLHEAWMKMDRANNPYRDRHHFMATAAQSMRQILVDLARRRSANKRGGGVMRQTTLSGLGIDCTVEEILMLNGIIDELQAELPMAGDVLLLRVFGGLTGHEAAAALGVGKSTVDRHWRFARAFVVDRLGLQGD